VESDLNALKSMHAESGFDYSFPNLDDQRYLVKIVAENGERRPCMAGLLRLTSEAYLLIDKQASGTPNERWERLQMLHETVRREASRWGIEDVHAFIPPEVPEGFFRRLKRMGWTEEKFRCMWTPVDRLN
jgi:hypothetical protein